MRCSERMAECLPNDRDMTIEPPLNFEVEAAVRGAFTLDGGLAAALNGLAGGGFTAELASPEEIITT